MIQAMHTISRLGNSVCVDSHYGFIGTYGFIAEEGLGDLGYNYTSEQSMCAQSCGGWEKKKSTQRGKLEGRQAGIMNSGDWRLVPAKDAYEPEARARVQLVGGAASVLLFCGACWRENSLQNLSSGYNFRVWQVRPDLLAGREWERLHPATPCSQAPHPHTSGRGSRAGKARWGLAMVDRVNEMPCSKSFSAAQFTLRPNSHKAWKFQK